MLHFECLMLIMSKYSEGIFFFELFTVSNELLHLF